MLSVNISDIAIITIKGVNYRWVIWDICKSEAIHLLENSVIDDREHTKKINIKNQVHYHYENLIKPRKTETKNIFIVKKSYKDFC